MKAPNNRSTKRHCMVVHAFYPKGETRVERQAQALLEHSYEVDVICLRALDHPAHEIVDGVQVHRLPVSRHHGGLIRQLLEYVSFFIIAFVHLTRLHLRRRYSTVQVHNLPDFLVFAALVPKLTGARIILDLHDLMPEFYAERFQMSMDSLTVKLIRWQEWLSCRFANHVITVTEPWRQTLIQRGQPADKVSVVMNVADSRIFHRHVSVARPDNDGHFNLIYHGSMDRRHGLELALKAINIVRHTAPDVTLTLHGGGEYRKTLESATTELGLQEHVHFSTRGLPTAELPKLLKKADLAIVPYLDGVFTGGILPTKMMEYAALGIPTIAARTPGIATYFDESMVQFFRPGDVEGLARCILTLYSDRNRRVELIEGSEKFTQRYNWAKLGAEYVALIERLGAAVNSELGIRNSKPV